MKKVTLLLVILISLTTTSCWEFNREQREKDAKSNGISVLLEAESSKKAMIEEAKAENEASILRASTLVNIAEAEALAEVARAKGVAEANSIIGQSLKDNESYLRYLWITGLHDGNGERIYIATEAGMPILEAGR